MSDSFLKSTAGLQWPQPTFVALFQSLDTFPVPGVSCQSVALVSLFLVIIIITIMKTITPTMNVMIIVHIILLLRLLALVRSGYSAAVPLCDVRCRRAAGRSIVCHRVLSLSSSHLSVLFVYVVYTEWTEKNVYFGWGIFYISFCFYYFVLGFILSKGLIF